MIRKLSLSSDYKTKLGLIKKSAKNQQSIVAFLEQNTQENSAVLCSNFGLLVKDRLKNGVGILSTLFFYKISSGSTSTVMRISFGAVILFKKLEMN